MYSTFLHTVLQIRTGYYYYYYTCYGYTVVVKLDPGIKRWKLNWGTERKWYRHCPTGSSEGDECPMTFLTSLTLLHQSAGIDTIESCLAHGCYRLFTQDVFVSPSLSPSPCLDAHCTGQCHTLSLYPQHPEVFVWITWTATPRNVVRLMGPLWSATLSRPCCSVHFVLCGPMQSALWGVLSY